jgi:hypothetical protein
MDFQLTDSLGDRTSDIIIESKLDEHFLQTCTTMLCARLQAGHDLTFRLEEYCAILGTTDILAFIYEY